MSSAPILITGGAGFIGCNLADRLASEGRDVIVFDSLARPGVEANLDWLERRHGKRIRRTIDDVRNSAAVERVVAEAGAVFHFAAQVAVTSSLSDPRLDNEVNIGGALNVLEAARAQSSPPPVVFASTNKVYGALADLAFTRDGDRYAPSDEAMRRSGVPEARPLDFHTPYGCSKGAADQYVLDYSRSFGVPTCVMRMSCIYGPRQLGTEDQGWVAHFLIQAMAERPIKIFGDGRQVRDILHVRDAVEAYVRALARISQISGQALNLGGGPDNAVSLLQVLDLIGEYLGQTPSVSFHPARPGDQLYYVSDTARLRALLDPPPAMGWRAGVRDLGDWLVGEHAPARMLFAGAAR